MSTFIPYGSMGFHVYTKYIDVDGVSSSARCEVSMLECYCYRFHCRRGEPIHLPVVVVAYSVLWMIDIILLSPASLTTHFFSIKSH